MNVKSDDTGTMLYHEKHKAMSMSLFPNKAILVVLSENFLGKSFIIEKNEILIGRGPGCDFKLDDQAVSKKHCRITFEDDGKFYIEDAGSSNSTYLNGKELKKKDHIIYGDQIIAGNTILRFFLEEKIDG
jgi:two-component system, cell cycle response regulator